MRPAVGEWAEQFPFKKKNQTIEGERPAPERSRTRLLETCFEIVLGLVALDSFFFSIDRVWPLSVEFLLETDSGYPKDEELE